jgi:hypothetical protein
MHAGENGSVHGKPIGGYRRAILESYADGLIDQLSKHPSMALKELQSWLASEHTLPVSITALDKFLRLKLGFRYNKTVVASEQQREDIAADQDHDEHDAPPWTGPGRYPLCRFRPGRPLTNPDLHYRVAGRSADHPVIRDKAQAEECRN